MEHFQFDADYCLMTKFSRLISGKWKPIILYLIENKIDRFNHMLNYLPTISRKILTEQLRSLESDGLILRKELKSKAPKVVVYHLTEKGRELRKLINEILNWGTVYLKDEKPAQ